MRIPFVDLKRQYLNLREELLENYDRVLQSGNYVLSEELKLFEENFAKYCGARYAVGVGNGSDALFLSLKALGLGPGDEVLTAPNSFISTAWAVVHTGAKLVFVDAADDFNIDPDLIQSSDQ